jgi:hypothetical protein
MPDVSTYAASRGHVTGFHESRGTATDRLAKLVASL